MRTNTQIKRKIDRLVFLSKMCSDINIKKVLDGQIHILKWVKED